MFYKICMFFVFITILFLFKNYFHKKEESNFYKQKEINGFIVNYYTNDNMIGKTIENGNLWGYENINQYKKYYKPNTDILDVGGFIGTNSLVLSKVIDRGNHIHVFEPQYYDCLIKNIKDNKLEDVIIPYGTGSLVSCDSTGNYFNLWMNGLQSERYYKFEFKVISGSNTVDETIQYYNDEFVFKVVR